MDTNALAPYVSGPGLSLGIKPGKVFVNGSLYFLPAQTLTLPPNATTYVYVDLHAPVGVRMNARGFYIQTIPIAVATTKADHISEFTDARPDYTT